MKEYYDHRAPEYDDWYLGSGLFAERDRPGWDEELARLCAVIESLPAGRTIDVACGTGFLTRHLRGDVTGLDQSARMLDVARLRAPGATFIKGDALELPFPNRSFDRLFSAHFYGHLDDSARARFLVEATRVAGSLVVVDSSRATSEIDEAMQERILDDGSRWEVYKRWFSGPGLVDELGGGTILHDGAWFVAVHIVL